MMPNRKGEPVVPVEVPTLPTTEYRMRLRSARINKYDHLALVYLASLPHWRGGPRYGATFTEIQDFSPTNNLMLMRKAGLLQWTVTSTGQRRYWITWGGIELLTMFEA